MVFRICEGPKERIRSLRFIGNTIVSTSRLEKIIKSRGPLLYVLYYAGNGADRAKIHSDKDLLEAYYHNLGYMRAQVDWIPKYDESGKWLDLTFVIDEGPLFTVTDVQIEGNVYVETQSLYDRITLKAGDAFNGTVMNQDVQSILYGYGDLGYLYADLKPKTYMNSDSNSVSLVYKIDEGERVRIGDIKIQIEGDPDRIHETAILNQLGIVEGQLLSRRIVERSEAVLMRLPLLETNPTIAPAPEFKIVPRDY
ncbi:MAG: POTRA domain-containing protein [Planctomycetota bacterium]